MTSRRAPLSSSPRARLERRKILTALRGLARGDVDVRLPDDHPGIDGQISEAFNELASRSKRLTTELQRLGADLAREGTLGGRISLGGTGAYADIERDVNAIADAFTVQLRELARVTTAVARGEVGAKLDMAARGEALELKNTINTMVDHLGWFAAEVTRAAQAVGTEGILGVHIDAGGLPGIWKDIVENVNLLSSNLTTQVRAVARFVDTVASGDLGQRLDVRAKGEIAELFDSINRMVRALEATTKANQEQDWLKTHLNHFTRTLQGQRDAATLGTIALVEIARAVQARHGVLYRARTHDARTTLELLSTYAAMTPPPREVQLGEGLVGQAAVDKGRFLLTDAPAAYVRIGSATGQAPAAQILVAPILFEGRVMGVVELASLRAFTPIELALLDQLFESLAVSLATIEAHSRLEEKAEQLALASRYKSRFLANMSHELRTPLHSMLILSRELAQNPRATLDPKEVDYARTIHRSGNDLLELINEILDLAKVESGTMRYDIGEVPLDDVAEFIEASFRPVADDKGLSFSIVRDIALPRALSTDGQRLKQILRNLLSNAFKFTDSGGVRLCLERVAHVEGLTESAHVAFVVEDSGPGIPLSQQELVFEPFQQADSATTRRHGGTGLGLAISRELAAQLGGTLRLKSSPGKGSTFTLSLPLRAPAVAAEPAPLPERMEIPALKTPTNLGDRLAEAAEAARSLSGKRVLVVDDDVRNIFALSAAFDRHDVDVVYAQNGREAVERFAEDTDLDYILMDVMMPEMDGYEAMRQIRAMAEGATVPIIALTAQAMAGDRERCFAAGASGYVTKPVDVDELFAIMVAQS